MSEVPAFRRAAAALRQAHVTLGLAALMVAAFIATFDYPEHLGQLALWPMSAPVEYVPFAPWQLATYAVVHANGVHLLFNVLSLLVFGAMLEQKIGRVRLLSYFVAGSVAGALAQLAAQAVSSAPFVPTTGASAGIYALAGVVVGSSDRSRRNQLIAVVLIVTVGGDLLSGRPAGSVAALPAHITGLLLGIGIALGPWRARPLLWRGALAAAALAAMTILLWPMLGHRHDGPPPTLAGVSLGASPAEVSAVLGEPAVRRKGSWMYTRDAETDAVLEVQFTPRFPYPKHRVFGVWYAGSPEHAPPELRDKAGRTREELARGWGDSAGFSTWQRDERTALYPGSRAAQFENGRAWRLGITCCHR